MEDKNKKIITSLWPKKDGHMDLLEYIETGGFSALKKALAGEIKAEDIISELEDSGLQGRGGGGFLTALKWRLAKEAVDKSGVPELPAESRAYFICNADESEPGTYKDRLIIEKSPYLALEGMILGAWTIGAERGIIYINGGYKDTAHILKKCIAVLEENGWLGKNIQKSEYSFQIEVFEGAGSYICGEESALLNSIEGKRGEPRLRPPYPAEKGLFGRPTVVNNVETLACAPFIIREGASAFKLLGKSEKSFGSKIFLLSGAVQKPGAYEAPLGTTLREIIEDYGGGLARGKLFKCAQVGGSCGSLYTEDDLDRPLGFGFESEIQMGSGAILVIDDLVDLKSLLLSWSSFFRRESCGKCVPCREGTYQLQLLAGRIKKGTISDDDKERMKDIIFTMQKASFCAFGSFAVNGWESLVRLYPEEIFEGGKK